MKHEILRLNRSLGVVWDLPVIAIAVRERGGCSAASLTTDFRSFDLFTSCFEVWFSEVLSDENAVNIIIKPKAAETITRWASTPLTFISFNTFLLTTFKADWDVQETNALMNPNTSNVGEFQLAQAIPTTIGTMLIHTLIPGMLPFPFTKIDIRIVNKGIPHFVVYVKEMPNRSRLMLLK